MASGLSVVGGNVGGLRLLLSGILQALYAQKEENDRAPELGQSFSEGVSAEATEDGAARESQRSRPTEPEFWRVPGRPVGQLVWLKGCSGLHCSEWSGGDALTRSFGKVLGLVGGREWVT